MLSDLVLGNPDRKLYKELVADLDTSAKEVDVKYPGIALVYQGLKKQFQAFYVEAARKQGMEIKFLTCGQCGGPVQSGEECVWCGAGIEVGDKKKD